MVQTAVEAPRTDPRPTLWRDPTYHGMNFTQFFGAFNDNLFKQLVLLICVNYAGKGGDYQQYAQALFALPFVLFSGFAGFLADRISKQRIVVAMKLAEIAVMIAGFLAFHSTFGRLVWLLCVVFLMGTHSAFFGPPKYGILPELFRETRPAAGQRHDSDDDFSGHHLRRGPGRLHQGMVCRPTVARQRDVHRDCGRRHADVVIDPPDAHRPSRASVHARLLFISAETWRMLRLDRPLFHVLLVSSLFWFLGGRDSADSERLRNPADPLWRRAHERSRRLHGDRNHGRLPVGRTRIEGTNPLRIRHARGLGHRRLPVGSGLARRPRGIGRLNGALRRGRRRERGSPWPRSSAAGSSAGESAKASPSESFVAVLVPSSRFEWALRGLLIGVGLFAGFFYVPLAVFMQARPPAELKGRMIGAMNLVNWIGIMLSAVFYGAAKYLCDSVLQVRLCWIFAMCASGDAAHRTLLPSEHPSSRPPRVTGRNSAGYNGPSMKTFHAATSMLLSLAASVVLQPAHASNAGPLDVLRVLEPGKNLDDPRLGRQRTATDKYHPWTPAATKAEWEKQSQAIRERGSSRPGFGPCRPRSRSSP